MLGKNRLNFPETEFLISSIYLLSQILCRKYFLELTLIFAYMNNTYTYVVASCAKTCCSRETFSQGLNIAFLLHAYVFTWHEKNMYTLVLKTLIIFFANMLLDILLQGEIYILR